MIGARRGVARFALSRRSVLAGMVLAGCSPQAPNNTVQSSNAGQAGSAVPPNPVLNHLYRARGGKPPADLIDIASAQAKIVAQAFADLKHYMWLPRAPGLTPPRFDWRDKHKVTPVRDQETCGDCWAFAATAAYESAYLIANNQTAPLSVSDQESLDCAIAPIGQIYDCGGGWHDGVFRYMVQAGEVAAALYRPDTYQAAKGTCASIADQPYHADTFGFVSGATIPTDVELKKALIQYGPLAVGVSAKGWDSNDGQIHFYSKKDNPNWAAQFPDGVFCTGDPSTPGLTMQNGVAPGIDHDVLLIGWDDNLRGSNGKRGAWIVKNSWGRDWGDDGVIKVSYGTCNIGFNAAWVKVRNQNVAVPSRVTNAVAALNANTHP